MAAESKRDLIIHVLIDMMETMSFDEIRAEDIIRRSGVSKTTFYRLFRDKYDVMNSAYLDASAAMVRKDPDMRNLRQWSIEDFQRVAQHPRFYQKILHYQGQNSFKDTLRVFYCQNIRRHVQMQAGDIPLTDVEQYAIDAYGEVATYTMTWWIMNGCYPPPEQAVDYVFECIPRCLRRYFETAESQ